MILRVIKVTKPIDTDISLIIGKVKNQANSSSKLKLKIVWLKNELNPTHLTAGYIIEAKASRITGIKI